MIVSEFNLLTISELESVVKAFDVELEINNGGITGVTNAKENKEKEGCTFHEN